MADIRSESDGSSWRSVTRASAEHREACPASITGTKTHHAEGRACPSVGCAYRMRSGRRGRHVPRRRPGVDRDGRGIDRLTWRLSRDLRRGPPVPERPPQGCRQARRWVRDSAGHNLLLIGRPLSTSAHECCLSRSTVRAGFHRAGRRWQRDKPGSLAVIGIALGWVTVGRGEWRPRAGAGVPQRAPGRASYCILRWWGCGLGQARRGHVCGGRRCRAWVLAGRAACGIWRVARSLSRLRRGGLNRGPRSPAPGIGRLWPVRAARRSGRGRGQPGERA